MRFKIDIRAADRVLEIVYPGQVTADDVAVYSKRCRELILMLGSHWNCFVDQTASPVLSPELADEISRLNSFAAANGMQRCARVVTSAVGQLQAQRIARGVQGNVEIRSFTNTQEAWDWLLQKPPSR